MVMGSMPYALTSQHLNHWYGATPSLLVSVSVSLQQSSSLNLSARLSCVLHPSSSVLQWDVASPLVLATGPTSNCRKPPSPHSRGYTPSSYQLMVRSLCRSLSCLLVRRCLACPTS